MSWRILYVESTDNLSLNLDNLNIKRDGENIRIPISDLHTVILDNYKINLSVHLINALTKGNVNLVLCGVDHLPQSVIHPVAGHHQAFMQLMFQFNWSLIIKQKIQQLIVKNKIENQVRLLKYLGLDTPTITALEYFHNEVEKGDATNREGLSAKMYFRTLFGDKFKRFNEDTMNAGLNYGYAILRSQITKVVIAKGYNPAIGIFHIGRNNPYNLSDDLIEVFRPIIDFWVYKHLKEEKMFLREHRLKLIEQTTKSVIINGNNQTIFNAINIYLDAIHKCFEQEKTSYFKKVNLEFDKL